MTRRLVFHETPKHTVPKQQPTEDVKVDVTIRDTKPKVAPAVALSAKQLAVERAVHEFTMRHLEQRNRQVLKALDDKVGPSAEVKDVVYNQWLRMIRERGWSSLTMPGVKGQMPDDIDLLRMKEFMKEPSIHSKP